MGIFVDNQFFHQLSFYQCFIIIHLSSKATAIGAEATAVPKDSVPYVAFQKKKIQYGYHCVTH
jgi:hypothetical protein